MEKHSEPLRLYLMKFVVRDSQFVCFFTTGRRKKVQKHPLNQMVWFRMLKHLTPNMKSHGNKIKKFIVDRIGISFSSHGFLYGFGLFLLI